MSISSCGPGLGFSFQTSLCLAAMDATRLPLKGASYNATFWDVPPVNGDQVDWQRMSWNGGCLWASASSSSAECGAKCRSHHGLCKYPRDGLTMPDIGGTWSARSETNPLGGWFGRGNYRLEDAVGEVQMCPEQRRAWCIDGSVQICKAACAAYFERRWPTVSAPLVGAASDDGMCTACPAGKYQNSTGAFECLSSEANWCPANATFDKDAIRCVCKAGFEGDSESRCVACRPGNFKMNSSAGRCSPCPAGQFSNSTGATSCSSCSPFADSDPGSSKCTCRAGYESNVDLRLVACTDEGCCRLEIYHDNVWGTVCDDRWDWSYTYNAEVVCREMGCDSAGSSQIQRFGGADYTMPIWLDNVECSGSENSLKDCSHAGWGDNNNQNCGHEEDVGVCCSGVIVSDLHTGTCGHADPSGSRTCVSCAAGKYKRSFSLTKVPSTILTVQESSFPFYNTIQRASLLDGDVRSCGHESETGQIGSYFAHPWTQISGCTATAAAYVQLDLGMIMNIGQVSSHESNQRRSRSGCVCSSEGCLPCGEQRSD